MGCGILRTKVMAYRSSPSRAFRLEPRRRNRKVVRVPSRYKCNILSSLRLERPAVFGLPEGSFSSSRSVISGMPTFLRRELSVPIMARV